MRGGWKCVSMGPGAQFAVMSLIPVMLLLSVELWKVSMELVRNEPH